MRCNCVPIKVGAKDHICTQSLVVDDNTFSSSRKLKSLYLDGNQLDQIPTGLPPGLVLLSLEVNRIYDISASNFSSVRNMEVLYLGQNCYYRNPCNVSYRIEDGTFSQLVNLTLLSLKSNNLSFVPRQLPASLKSLYLHNNNIEEVTEDDFRNLTNLETLDLSGNCPRCYNVPFPCTPCPKNSPLGISMSAFTELRKLQSLLLHSNSLRRVLPEWFHGTTDLRVLDLSANFLASDIGTSDFTRYLSKLEELDLSFNYELQEYPRTLTLSKHFSKLQSLKILRLEGLVFQTLQLENVAPLRHLPNLEVIDLGTNFIKTTNFSVLMGFPNYKIVSLSNNKISAQGQNEGGPSLWSQTLAEYQYEQVRGPEYFRYDEYARSCRYKEKDFAGPKTLATSKCSQYGKTLDLSRNNIFFLHAGFLNLPEVRCLNLSGNAMSQSLNGSEFIYLSRLEYLDFTFNRMDLRYASAFQELKRLVILDISYNNHYFESEGLTHMLNFTRNLKKLKILRMNHNKISTSTNTEMESESLEKLEFRDNRLDVFWRDGDTRYVGYFKKLLALKVLDISQNNLDFIPSQVFGNLPETLSSLLLKHNRLKSFPWEKLGLIPGLRVLDLSSNSLSTLPSVLSNCSRSLKKLILHHNKILSISPNFLAEAYDFKYLDVSFNHIRHIEESSFPDDIVDQMEMLLLDNNDFVCTCNVTSFVRWLNATKVFIPNLATQVTCAAPLVQRGRAVISVDLLACQHGGLSAVLFAVNSSLVLISLVLCISSHLFLWDVWYIYHFCWAKLKGYRPLPTRDSLYDAFVLYDKDDAAVTEWVAGEMSVQLEERGDRRLVLCLEDRDWIPGHPLIDNLSRSIHESKRTVFVLTNEYIRSGNFKTAFYMAHQRLMDEKTDVIVLILLEDVPCNSKYLRLRKRLYKRSVLQWPANPRAQPYFWFSVRSVLATESHKQYNNLFKETL
ncbi:toll-like receptor 7 [Stigmatopora nigra]